MIRKFFAVCGVVVLGWMSAKGELLYSTKFDGPDGGQPSGWTVNASGVSLGLQKNEYRLSSGTGWVLAYIDGADLQGNPSSNWKDYVVRSQFRQVGSAFGGIVARIQNSTSFYMARFDGRKSTFELYRVGGPGTKLLASQADISYRSGQSWSMELAVAGASLTARLLDKNSSEVAAISAVDSSFSAGSAGVRGNPMNNVVVWENLVVDRP